MKRWTMVLVCTSAFAATARAEISSLLRSQLAQRAAKKAPGSEPVGTPIGGYLSSRQSITGYVTMEPGRCYIILGVGGQGVRDLDLALHDPNGKRVATDLGFDPTPLVQHCAKRPGAFKLDATVKRGSGEVAVQAYAKAGAAGGADPPSGSDALDRHIEAAAQSLVPGARRVGDFLAGGSDKGRRNDWLVPLEAGRCYTFIATGGAGVQLLSQFLWDPAGRRVTGNEAKSAESVMGWCAAVPGAYHLHAKVQRGGGALRVGVYAKKP